MVTGAPVCMCNKMPEWRTVLHTFVIGEETTCFVQSSPPLFFHVKKWVFFGVLWLNLAMSLVRVIYAHYV